MQSSLATLAPESHQLCSTVAVNQLIGQLLKDNDSTLFLDSATSSGLVKHLATKNRSFLVSPERFDVINKLLKSDDENASGADENASVTLQAIFWETSIILVCFKKEIMICNIKLKISLATFNNFYRYYEKDKPCIRGGKICQQIWGPEYNRKYITPTKRTHNDKKSLPNSNIGLLLSL